MSEYQNNNQSEKSVQNFDVGELSNEQLRELEHYLSRQKIDINQRMLQNGTVSAGYKKQGVIELVDGKIGFWLRDLNYVVVGTPQEFLTALRTINPEL